MARKTGKNVAKKSRSRIRNQKVSRSSRRNSGRNSVVKRKKKSRRKQRGRGNNSGANTADSDVRPECKDEQVEEAAKISDKDNKPDEAKCLMTNDQCKEQGRQYEINNGSGYSRPWNAPCVNNQICKLTSHASYVQKYNEYRCVDPDQN